MISHRTTYRVIYGDTDNMGVAYHANYLRWFEKGRAEMFRALGLPYREIEQRGMFLPVAEAHCKYVASARYDDLLIIEATIDLSFRSGMKFDYRIFNEDGTTLLATGYTKHACVNVQGRVIRPPAFILDLIRQGPIEHSR
jgi:acyl-CoA thioester hydrolase